VESSELKALLTPESLRLLEAMEAPGSDDDLVSTVSALRRAGHDPDRVHAVMNQLSLRSKAYEKFGDFARGMLFTKEGLEQSTRLDVASHHAGRMRSVGITSLADIGCGIGGDSLAFAGLGMTVRAIERDTVTAALASYNLAAFDTVTVVNAEATEADLSGVEALWIDPARRDGSTRLWNPSDWSPSLDWVFQKAHEVPSGIKLAPGMDRSLIPQDMEAQWVSHDGVVVEMVLWSGSLRRHGVLRAALVLNSRGATELTGPRDSPDAEGGEIQEFLYEPDGAVIRARLIGDLARSLGGVMVDPSIAYITSSELHHSPLHQGFRVIDSAPYSVKNVSALVSSASLGHVEIKKRGIDIDPATLRKSLPLTGKKSGTIIVTRLRGVKTAILATRVDSVGKNVASTH
jgi:hypothetical protein